MNRDALIALTAPILFFLALSFIALGPCLIVMAFHLDDYGWAYAVGHSMYPTIKSGAIIIFDKTPDQIKLGDIIVYKYWIPPQYIAYYPPQYLCKWILIGHRVVAITDRGYYVLGDNNTMVDPWIVPKKDVVGKVVWIINDEPFKSIALFWFNILGYKEGV